MDCPYNINREFYNRKVLDIWKKALDSGLDSGLGEDWVGANIVEYRLSVYLQTCANANVEPSGHRNAQYDKKNGDPAYAPFSEGVPSEWP